MSRRSARPVNSNPPNPPNYSQPSDYIPEPPPAYSTEDPLVTEENRLREAFNNAQNAAYSDPVIRKRWSDARKAWDNAKKTHEQTKKSKNPDSPYVKLGEEVKRRKNKYLEIDREWSALKKEATDAKLKLNSHVWRMNNERSRDN